MCVFNQEVMDMMEKNAMVRPVTDEGIEKRAKAVERLKKGRDDLDGQHGKDGRTATSETVRR